jgi:carbonic anhydrase
MRKLIRGIVDFRKKVLPSYRDTFAELALGQKPDTLFIACCDSRVVPDLFASTDPGDLFVLRNVGNLIAPSGRGGMSVGDESEAAAIEFALNQLPVTDIIICGHSECGAMAALTQGRETVDMMPHLKSWLRHGDPALKKLKLGGGSLNGQLAPHNQLSQINVLQQIEHLMTYSIIKERVDSGKLRLHGWWFDVTNADVYSYDEETKKFELIDEKKAPVLLKKLDS